MDQPKRRHRATGKKPPGGARPGAGRPLGVKNVLELGEAQAIKALRWKVPESTPAPIADAAGEAFFRIVEVMRGDSYVADPANTLRAAFRVRDEACGQPTQRVEHTGKDGETLTIQINKYGKEDE